MILGRERLELQGPAQLRLMHRAGGVVADMHTALREAIGPGVRTSELDQMARGVLEEAGATSNFLGYHGFPATICVSVNEEIVHGIPGDRVLEPGDLVSVDCGAVVEGRHGDAAFSVLVEGGDDAQRAQDQLLIDATEAALWAGIAAFATADRVGEIGFAIEHLLAEREEDPHHPSFGIVREYTGHGIGSAMHLPPDVVNFASRDRTPRVRPGLCLAIEPMLTAGTEDTAVLGDDWTVVTADGSRAAHVEHSVARHDGGIWVLTAHDGGAAGLAAYGIAPVPVV
ncbi:methionyl aminopeptidase [Bogoriella caseilytica]|uniref:Methionine aminopeptidase n=1 Tax=Bogoriella caseilytica TaxID=56055 RepID=A0A3N2BE63_9MICO|nr:methionyl aminopeptidase [Bogoriella caseilytica]